MSAVFERSTALWDQWMGPRQGPPQEWGLAQGILNAESADTAERPSTSQTQT